RARSRRARSPRRRDARLSATRPGRGGPAAPRASARPSARTGAAADDRFQGAVSRAADPRRRRAARGAPLPGSPGAGARARGRGSPPGGIAGGVAKNRDYPANVHARLGFVAGKGSGMGGKAPRVAKPLPQSPSQIVSDADPGSYVSKSRAHTLKLLSLVHGDDESIAGLPVSPNPGVTADVAGLTHAGMVRSSNQDQFLIAGLERALLVEDSSLPAGPGTRLGERPQGRIFIVADGIGGHGGGEVASAVATDAMAHYAFAAMPWVLSGVGAT